MIIRLGILLAVLVIGVVVYLRDGISNQIEQMVFDTTTATVDLSRVGPSDWTRVCVLPPYTDNKAAEAILGFPWDAEGNTWIEGSDGHNVLVFIKNAEVIAYTEHRRDEGDFSKLRPHCLKRDESILVRKKDESGWVYLVRPGG